MARFRMMAAICIDQGIDLVWFALHFTTRLQTLMITNMAEVLLGMLHWSIACQFSISKGDFIT